MNKEEFSMKAFIIGVIGIISVIVCLKLFSCEKYYCWDCEMITTNVRPWDKSVDTVYFERCGWTEDAIRELEKSNTYVDTVTSCKIIQLRECKCEKQ